MKKILTVVLMLACLSGFGQSLQWRNLDSSQFGSNLFRMSLKSGVVATNAVIYQNGGLTYPLVVQGDNGLRINNSAGSQTALVSGLGVFTGNGIGLTNLNATNITSGTVPTSRLPWGLDTIVGNRKYTNVVTVTSTISNALLTASAYAGRGSRVMIYVPDGTYDETNLMLRYVDLIGQSRDGVIVTSTNTTSDTLTLGGLNCMIANLTLRHITPATATQKYAAHVDAATPSQITKSDIIFYNCTVSTIGANDKTAIGAGLYGNQDLYIINSTLTSQQADGLFLHNQASQSLPAHCFIVNSVLIGTNGYGLTLQSQGSGQSDYVSIANSYISGGVKDILTQNSGSAVGEFLLCFATNDYYACTLASGTMQLTNANAWIKTPMATPRLLADVWGDMLTVDAAGDPVWANTTLTAKGKVTVGTVQGAYTGMLADKLNVFGSYSIGVGNIAVFSTNAAATDKGGSIGGGGPNGTGNTPTLFGQIIWGRESGGTYHGNTIFYTANGAAASLSEAMRIKSTGKIGIGMTNPAALLDVAGTIRGSNGVYQTASYNSSAGTAFNWSSNNLYAGRITCSGAPVFITNSIITASSVIGCCLNTDDATASTPRLTNAAGIMVVRFLVAPTANYDLSWWVISP